MIAGIVYLEEGNLCNLARLIRRDIYVGKTRARRGTVCIQYLDSERRVAGRTHVPYHIMSCFSVVCLSVLTPRYYDTADVSSDCHTANTTLKPPPG